jgi:DNA-directed RNA polymerase specialized sigma24 family protein
VGHDGHVKRLQRIAARREHSADAIADEFADAIRTARTDGMTYRQIGAALGVSEQAVRQFLKRRERAQ